MLVLHDLITVQSGEFTYVYTLLTVHCMCIGIILYTRGVNTIKRKICRGERSLICLQCQWLSFFPKPMGRRQK